MKKTSALNHALLALVLPLLWLAACAQVSDSDRGERPGYYGGEAEGRESNRYDDYRYDTGDSAAQAPGQSGLPLVHPPTLKPEIAAEPTSPDSPELISKAGSSDAARPADNDDWEWKPIEEGKRKTDPDFFGIPRTEEEPADRAGDKGQQTQQQDQQQDQQQRLAPPPPPKLERSDKFIAKPGEDIWVIVKPTNVVEDNIERGPGCGAMIAIVPPDDNIKQQQQQQQQLRQAGPRYVPMPLKHTDVKASVTGYIATVDVTQQFHNPYSQKIEAIYQFPLPQDAAVSEFVMEVGPPDARRKIRGIIREKEEAQRIYNQAKAQGHNASLLSQVRPNIFEQKVANIEPGKQIDIQIRYFNTLQYADGWYEFTFPMVVGPRYNPPGSEDPVNASPRGTTPANKGTTVTYLRPNERSGHDIGLTLDIDAGVSIEEANSPTHTVMVRPIGGSPNKVRVELSKNDAIPNKDFVYRFRVAGKTMKSGLVTHVDEKGRGYFTLMLYPPAELKSLERQAMEMVFVLDCSGSMRGDPMNQSKDAMRHALKQLREDDTFQVIRFSNNASQFGPKPVPATKENIEKAISYVDTLSGSGGTRMIEGIKAALDFPHDVERLRTVTFLTDGYIGNEDQILREMQARMGASRVFSFGVGSSPNRFLLNRMAKAGRGASAFLLPGDSGKEVMDLYFNRISHPALTDLEISWGGAEVAQVYPSRLPDLLVGRPVIVTGRFSGELNDLAITGRLGGKRLTMRMDEENTTRHPAIGQVWARRKIADLMDQMTREGNQTHAPTVLTTALEYSLVSKYTSFIAVDASRITEGNTGTTVLQALPVPEGVKYENTVGQE